MAETSQNEYYINHKTDRLTYQKHYNAEHVEEIKEYQHNYYAENREKKCEQQIKYNKEHREDIREYSKRLYRERISIDKVECGCGSVVIRKNKKAHNKTTKHLEWENKL